VGFVLFKLRPETVVALDVVRMNFCNGRLEILSLEENL
jgi:hypothetical protein